MSGLSEYLDTLKKAADNVAVSDQYSLRLDRDETITKVIELMRNGSMNGNKIIFVGNGGSASIASHMAIDYSKNGRLPAVSFNDGAALTCIGNDLGYENVFSEQIKLHAKQEDLLIAISSSGASKNILNAVAQARSMGCTIVTMSGFSEENPLRQLGDINWYVPSSEYGFVEITHLTLCHAILDTLMGWDTDK
jgi:D-sedoheptulose 7-phosphate isomerase